MLRRAAKLAVGTRTGRRASGKAIKVAVGTPRGRKALRAGAGVALKTGRGVVASRAGRKALKGGAATAAKAGKGVGKYKLRGAAGGSGKPSRRRYLTYGLVALAGFVAGALLARSGKNDSASSSFTGTTGTHTPEPGSPAAERGQTWGSGTALSGSGGTEQVSPEVAGREQQEAEQRIRTALGEDPRTQDMPRTNVAVTDGIAELRGPAPSEEARQAASEIAASVEGVREVRNLMVVE